MSQEKASPVTYGVDAPCGLVEADDRCPWAHSGSSSHKLTDHNGIPMRVRAPSDDGKTFGDFDTGARPASLYGRSPPGRFTHMVRVVRSIRHLCVSFRRPLMRPARSRPRLRGLQGHVHIHACIARGRNPPKFKRGSA